MSEPRSGWKEWLHEHLRIPGAQPDAAKQTLQALDTSNKGRSPTPAPVQRHRIQPPTAEPDTIGRGRREVIQTVLTYENFINEASTVFGIPAGQIQALIANESRGDPGAGADHAARGLMQINKLTWDDTTSRGPTAQRLRTHLDMREIAFDAHQYDPRINILVGTAAFLNKTRGLQPLAGGPRMIFTAYNAGAETVRQAVANATTAHEADPNTSFMHEVYLRPAIEHTRIYYSNRFFVRDPQTKVWMPRGDLTVEEAVRQAVDAKLQEVRRYAGRVEDWIRDFQTVVDEANARDPNHESKP